jgi:hypothetical protein
VGGLGGRLLEEEVPHRVAVNAVTPGVSAESRAPGTHSTECSFSLQVEFNVYVALRSQGLFNH